MRNRINWSLVGEVSDMIIIGLVLILYENLHYILSLCDDIVCM